MRLRYNGATGSQLWEGDAREVAAAQAPGSFHLAILDGPYGLKKAEWDYLPRGGLLELYEEHLQDVHRLCAPSASLYVWNTAGGWAELHPRILADGWRFKSLVVWNKTGGAQALKSAHEEGAREWPEIAEFCGFYQREAWAPSTCAGQEIAYAAGRDERNWVRLWIGAEWSAAGLSRKEADECLGTATMASRHFFGASQWCLPTWEHYQQMAAHAQAKGPPRDRPYLVHERFWPEGGLQATYDHLRAEHDHLRAEHDHLRAEYDASRPAFACPYGVGSVWSAPAPREPERLTRPEGGALHPCQKPIAFAERMLRASSRPGERVWVPFGGTCRELVAAEAIARAEPREARTVIAAELNGDGVDYIGPVLEQVRGWRLGRPEQTSLFGGGR